MWNQIYKITQCVQAFKDEAEYYLTLAAAACRHSGWAVSQLDVEVRYLTLS